MTGMHSALVIDGETLSVVMGDAVCLELFVTVSRACAAVLCCRMSPIQKARIVAMVKTHMRMDTDVRETLCGEHGNECVRGCAEETYRCCCCHCRGCKSRASIGREPVSEVFACV